MKPIDQKMIEFFHLLSVLNASNKPLTPGELASLTRLPTPKVVSGIEGLKAAGFPLAHSEGRWFMTADREGLELREVLGLMLAAVVDLPDSHPSRPIVERAQQKVSPRTPIQPVSEVAPTAARPHLHIAPNPPEPQTPPEPVAIEFTAEAAAQIYQTPWRGGDQRTAEKPDGSMVLSLETPITPEFVQWVQSFGGQAKVLFPFALQEQVGDEQLQAA